MKVAQGATVVFYSPVPLAAQFDCASPLYASNTAGNAGERAALMGQRKEFDAVGCARFTVLSVEI